MHASRTPTAVVTGASYGLGAVYADRLARQGNDLVLVARSRQELERVAAEIREETGRHVDVIVAHLGVDDQLAAVERRILEDDSIGVAVTCVRVPVRVGHSESVNIQTREYLTVDRALELLSHAPGLIVENVPSPLRSEGRDEVYVGRVRRDESHPNALSMFVVADNLRKGAATNAVQIAELLLASADLRDSSYIGTR